MADGTKIEWTDATVNAVNGCSVVSPGCTNCYAMRLAGTRLQHHASRAGLTMPTKAGPVWTGEVRLNEKALLEPLRWRRPRQIFWNAHGDLFHPAVPDEWIDRCFAVMALTPQHIHQVLTKRPGRMREYLCRQHRQADVLDAASQLPASREQMVAAHVAAWPPPNIWLGTSVEDQARADERIPHLLATPAAVRWLSCEPLLGPVDLEPWLAWRDGVELPNGDTWGCHECDGSGYLDGCETCPKDKAHFDCEEGPTGRDGAPDWMVCHRVTLDWVVVGGESGPGARPMHPDWGRSLRDQCAAAGVPFFFKQHGNWTSVDMLNPIGRERFRFPDGCEVSRVSKPAAGRLLDGVEHNGMPA